MIVWILFGALSVISLVIALCLASKRNSKAYHLSFASLVFISLTLLMEYKLVADWVINGDASAIIDVVPYMFTPLLIYVIIMVILNLLVLYLVRKKRDVI